MQATTNPGLTANDRLKNGSANRTRIGILLAVALHFGLFELVTPFQAAELRSVADEIVAVSLPPEVKIPAPPEQIARPGRPRVSPVAIPQDVTIAPTTFETNPVEHLPLPAAPVAREDDRPSFIPYDTPPALINTAHVSRLLEQYYPKTLSDAGIGGSIVLWLYVDETGLVLRHEVKTSSGNSMLDRAAGRVVSEMIFSPAKNRDKVTAVWVQQLVTFHVR